MINVNVPERDWLDEDIYVGRLSAAGSLERHVPLPCHTGKPGAQDGRPSTEYRLN